MSIIYLHIPFYLIQLLRRGLRDERYKYYIVTLLTGKNRNGDVCMPVRKRVTVRNNVRIRGGQIIGITIVRDISDEVRVNIIWKTRPAWQTISGLIPSISCLASCVAPVVVVFLSVAAIWQAVGRRWWPVRCVVHVAQCTASIIIPVQVFRRCRTYTCTRYIPTFPRVRVPTIYSYTHA